MLKISALLLDQDPHTYCVSLESSEHDIQGLPLSWRSFRTVPSIAYTKTSLMLSHSERDADDIMLPIFRTPFENIWVPTWVIWLHVVNAIYCKILDDPTTVDMVVNVPFLLSCFLSTTPAGVHR